MVNITFKINQIIVYNLFPALPSHLNPCITIYWSKFSQQIRVLDNWHGVISDKTRQLDNKLPRPYKPPWTAHPDSATQHTSSSCWDQHLGANSTLRLPHTCLSERRVSHLTQPWSPGHVKKIVKIISHHNKIISILLFAYYKSWGSVARWLGQPLL